MQKKSLQDRRQEVASFLHEMQEKLSGLVNEMRAEASSKGMIHTERAQMQIDLEHLKKLGLCLGSNVTYFEKAAQAKSSTSRESPAPLRTPAPRPPSTK